MALKTKRVVLRTIKPNAGVHSRYRAELDKLLRSARNDVLALVDGNWQDVKPATPSRIALDADNSWIARAVDALLSKWMDKLSGLAENLASTFVGSSALNYDRNLSRQLRAHGFTAKLQMSGYVAESLRMSIGENVGLIRSIPTEYLADVSKYVWEAAAGGFDLGTLTNNLEHTYHIGRNRAKLIARDQANKANAVIEHARRKELGITKAIWMHSSAAKVPRQSHVRANGKEFDADKGMLIDGEYIQAGQKINCHPGDMILSDGERVKQLWRRRYSGKLTEIVMESGKSIKATPNHPVLTHRGWVAIKDVNKEDYLIERLKEGFNAVKGNIKSGNTSFAEVFNAASSYIVPSSRAGSAFEFHGDISDSEVETVDFERVLPSEINATALQEFFKLMLSVSDHVIEGVEGNIFDSKFNALNALFSAPQSIVSRSRLLFALATGETCHLHGGGLASRSTLDAIVSEARSNCSPATIEHLGKLELANTGSVESYNLIGGQILAILSGWSGDGVAEALDLGAESLAVDVSSFFGSIYSGERVEQYKLHRVVEVGSVNFSGHVYNLHNEKNYYSVESLVSHNCGCTSRSIIEF